MLLVLVLVLLLLLVLVRRRLLELVVPAPARRHVPAPYTLYEMLYVEYACKICMCT